MISRCPSCAAQVDEDAQRCPSCHWDFNEFKHIPPAGQANNPTVAPKAPSAEPPPPRIPEARSVPPPPTVDPSVLPKARARAELPGAGLTPTTPPMADSRFAVPTHKPEAKDDPQPEPELNLDLRLKPQPKPEPKHEGKGEAKGKILPKEPAKEPAKEAAREPRSAVPERPELRKNEDVAARFRRKAPLSEAKKAAARKAPGVDPVWIAIILGGVVVAGAAVGLTKLFTRSDAPVGGTPEAASPFAKDVNGVSVDAQKLLAPASKLLAPDDDSRDISRIQRAAIDPSHPELGAMAVPVGAPPAPAQAPVSVSAEPPPPPTPGRSAPPAPAVAAAPAQAAIPSPATAPAPAATAPRRAPSPDALDPRLHDWAFKGEVYDLVTLDPVYAAQLTFLDPFGRVAGKVATNGKGRYKMVLPALDEGGYTIQVAQPDYSSNFIDDISPSIRTLGAADRRTLMKAAPSKKPWLGSMKAVITRDLVLVPADSQ